MIKMQCKIKAKEINMMKIDPGAIGFTSGFSQDNISIEKCIVMRISRHDHVYRHHVRDK